MLKGVASSGRGGSRLLQMYALTDAAGLSAAVSTGAMAALVTCTAWAARAAAASSTVTI
jgi:hypothetical protein